MYLTAVIIASSSCATYKIKNTKSDIILSAAFDFQFLYINILNCRYFHADRSTFLNKKDWKIKTVKNGFL